ncbi:MAG TPA: PqqD family protein [Candidatus Acidoferrales bacterium]|nr:PqqD family protein [Candidatus Acidoferrales bacterium]
MNPRKADDLEIRTVGDEVLVHHLSAQKVHILNKTAGDILALCDGARSKADIVTSICAATKADQATVERDIDDLLAEFAKLGLVTE